MNLSLFFSIIVAISVVSLISVVAIIPLARFNKNKNLIKLLVAFAAGSLIGDVFFHILPELVETFEIGYSFAIVAGILAFFIFEQFFHWRHCHNEIGHKHSLATSSLMTDFIHNFVDGILIASSFYISKELGVATTIAVILHEVPQEIGDFAILLHSKVSKKKAIFFNFVTSLSAFIGALIFVLLSDSFLSSVNYIVSFGAGSFLYLAIADLLPEIKHDHCDDKTYKKLFFFILGLLIMGLLIVLE